MRDALVMGYLDKRYAESFSEFGTSRELPRCRGWILERQIPDRDDHDAMGCYPRFACQDWSQLHLDLQHIGNELVSLSLVTDPFGEYELSYLRDCFNVVIPYKEHFVVDLQQSIDGIGSQHHRKLARKSLKKVQIELCPDPTQWIDEWDNLYANIIKRHNIKGMQALSKPAFAKQLSIPGTVMFRANYEGHLMGLHWYYEQAEIVYAHLAALTPGCYLLGASYALHWSAIEYFAGKKRWLDLGSGAGVHNEGTDGLTLFKRGWSTGTLPSYFCGRVFDQARYYEIVKSKNIGITNFFPAYRESEFASA